MLPKKEKCHKRLCSLDPSINLQLNEHNVHRVQRIQGVVTVQGVSLMSV